MCQNRSVCVTDGDNHSRKIVLVLISLSLQAFTYVHTDLRPGKEGHFGVCLMQTGTWVFVVPSPISLSWPLSFFLVEIFTVYQVHHSGWEQITRKANQAPGASKGTLVWGTIGRLSFASISVHTRTCSRTRKLGPCDANSQSCDRKTVTCPFTCAF